MTAEQKDNHDDVRAQCVEMARSWIYSKSGYLIPARHEKLVKLIKAQYHAHEMSDIPDDKIVAFRTDLDDLINKIERLDRSA